MTDLGFEVHVARRGGLYEVDMLGSAGAVHLTVLGGAGVMAYMASLLRGAQVVAVSSECGYEYWHWDDERGYWRCDAGQLTNDDLLRKLEGNEQG